MHIKISQITAIGKESMRNEQLRLVCFFFSKKYYEIDENRNEKKNIFKYLCYNGCSFYWLFV